jgi:hypothetical protein
MKEEAGSPTIVNTAQKKGSKGRMKPGVGK